MIRIDRIRAHNMGPFKDVDVDIAAIPGLLVAVTGDNGAGKSTLLEMWPGGMFRDTWSRGTLADLATARDSSLTVDVVNGHAWRIHHTLDAVNGKGETLVTGADGPALPDTKVKFFDAWAKSHLPAPEVLYASTFAAQKSGGFLQLKPGDRKAVLLRVLGVERLEAQAKTARENAAAARTALATLDARIGDERVRSGSVEDARRDVDVAELVVSMGEAAVAKAREGLREWEAERAILDAAQLEARRHEERAAGLRQRIVTEEQALADVTTRLANNREALAQELDVRAAVARRTEIAAEVARLEVAAVAAEGTYREACASATAAAATAAGAERTHREARVRSDEAERRHAEAKARLGEREAVLAAVEQAKGAEATRNAARDLVTVREGELDALRGQRVVGAEGRIVSLRGGFVEITKDGTNGSVVAVRTLSADDETVNLAASLPARTREAETALLAAKRALSEAEATLAALLRTAARLDVVQRAETDAATAWDAFTASCEQLNAANLVRLDALDVAQRARVGADALRDAGKAERASIASLQVEGRALEPVAAKLPRVEAAAGRIAELEPQVAAGKARVEALRAELALVPTPEARAALRPSPDVGMHDRALVDAQNRLALARAAVTRAEEGAARLAALGDERARAFADVEDWSLLADSLGRDGIQASEIDAAGPELTTLINDLLHTCVGSRWTVTIDTQRVGGGGKLIEGLEVRVLDTQEGREGLAETLSGGQQVLVGEAVSLALTMLACRRSGVVGATIVRDETGAALTQANARAYMAMLRRAAEIVGASHVLFVSHTPEIAELADARIHVENGTAVVS